MVDPKERACQSVRTWMARVLKDKGWTANEWARAAHTTPTNITRLLNGNDKVPSVETVMKLASVARSQPDLIGWAETGALPAAIEHPHFCPQCGYDLQKVTPIRAHRAR